MKVFWCTRYKKNKGKFHGEELLLDNVSSATLRQIDKVYDEENAYKLKHVDLPIVVRILKFIFFMVAFLLSMVLLQFIEEIFETTEMQVTLVVCIVCWILFLIPFVVEQTRKKNYEKSERYQLYQKRLDGLYDYLYSELGVPADAPCVDVIRFNYVLMGDKVVPFQKNKNSEKYYVVDFKFYVEKENLCISTDEEVYGIKLSSIKGIKRTDKKIHLLLNTSVGNRAEKLKKHNVKKRLGAYIINPYYILEFEHKNEKWGLYFPCYELPVIEELTGLKAN